MAHPDLKSLDEYQIYLTEKMTPWSSHQRVALAAAIAEHWLPAYESFSKQENDSLIIGSEDAGDFHDWPETWQRSRGA